MKTISRRTLLKSGLAAAGAGAISLIPGKVSAATYSRIGAVNYALRWANDFNPYYPKAANDCANFVSQCLREAGFSEDSEWWSDYGYIWPWSRSSSAWVSASGLYSYLTRTWRARFLKSFKIALRSDAALLRPMSEGVQAGDLIRCDFTSSLFHIMIVTGFEYSRGFRMMKVSQHNKPRRDISFVDSMNYALTDGYVNTVYRVLQVGYTA